jgi:hypothetical protein
VSTSVPISPHPYLVSAADAARLLACRPFDVVKLCRSGELPSGRIGRRWVIPVEAVRAFADNITSRDSLTSEDLQIAFHHGLEEGRRQVAEAEHNAYLIGRDAERLGIVRRADDDG